jgi:hypothetical protein
MSRTVPGTGAITGTITRTRPHACSRTWSHARSRTGAHACAGSHSYAGSRTCPCTRSNTGTGTTAAGKKQKTFIAGSAGYRNILIVYFMIHCGHTPSGIADQYQCCHPDNDQKHFFQHDIFLPTLAF